MFSFLRHQLPAYSPLAAKPLFSAVAGAVLRPSEELQQARALVAREFMADEVALLDSGRSALQLAINLALWRKPTVRVVGLPGFQCFEVAAAAVGADCRIVLYDVDPNTLSPDLASLDKVLRLGVSAIVVAPLYGMPVDWDAVTAVLRPYGALAIEDAAQGHGAAWRDRPLGSLGDLSVLSFGRGKGWTGGGGGALCLRGTSVRTHYAMDFAGPPMSVSGELRAIASAFAQWVAGRPDVYAVPSAIPGLELGETRYHPPTTPRRAGSFSAALLRRTFDACRREADVRRHNAAQWRARLPPEVLAGAPAVPAAATAGYLRFALRVGGKAGRGRRDCRAGVARSYPMPLNHLAAVADRLAHAMPLPGAERLARELVTLPTHSKVTERDRAHILSLCGSWRRGT